MRYKCLLVGGQVTKENKRFFTFFPLTISSKRKRSIISYYLFINYYYTLCMLAIDLYIVTIKLQIFNRSINPLYSIKIAIIIQ